MAARTIPLAVSLEDRAELQRLIRSGKTEQRLGLRARIVVLAADGLSDRRIAEELSISRPTVADWRKRFAAEGMAGLKRNRPRVRRFVALGKAMEDAVVEQTLHEKPPEGTHWSCRSMAEAMGISKNSVQRIWNANGLKPGYPLGVVRTFKLSNDPDFVEKLQDVVRLYLNPPEHALVLSIDEKSQIQALDRTQPGLPMKQGRAGTMTHDYKRNGTTTLFAALDVLKGEVIGQCLPRHRHQEFLTFLKTIDRWFAEITNQRIRRGVFRSVKELEGAITDYIQHNNANPKPLIWTKSADEIVDKVNRGKAMLGTQH